MEAYFKENWWRFILSVFLLASTGSFMQLIDLDLTRCVEHAFDASDAEPGILFERVSALLVVGPTRLLGIPSVLIVFSLLPFYKEFMEYVGDLKNLFGTVVVYIFTLFAILWLALAFIALAFHHRPVPLVIWILVVVLLPVVYSFKNMLREIKKQREKPESSNAVADVSSRVENKITTAVFAIVVAALLFVNSIQESVHRSGVLCETQSGAPSQSVAK